MNDARMDQVESRFAIDTLIANYAHGFDGRDIGLFLSLWWEDCTLVAPGLVGIISGHAALSDLVERQLWPAWQWSMHIVTNSTIRFEDEDPHRAHGLSNVCCLGQDDRGVGQALFASYRDMFERRSGTWKFASRTVDMRWQGTTEALIGGLPSGLAERQ